MNDVKRNLDEIRDKLVEKINENGGTLKEDTSISDCINAIDSVTGGTDTSDATVTAGKMLEGVTAYGAAGKITGNIKTVTASKSGNIVTVPAGYISAEQKITVGTSQAAKTYTPGTADQTIAAGKYLSGVQTIKGDANLTAENIKDGVSIFNVTGSLKGGGAFYKCASVDASTNTWQGYKLIQREDGIYEIDSILSTLSYSLNLPVTGKIYSEDGIIEVAYIPIDTGIPEDNLLVYLVGDSFSDASGNGIGIDNWANRVGLMEYDGFKCFYKAGDDAILKCCDIQNAMWFDSNRSYSVKMCIPEEPSADVEYQVVRFDWLGNVVLDNFYLSYSVNEKKWHLNTYGDNGGVSAEVQIQYGEWFHIGGTIEFNGGDRATITQYFNGIMTATTNDVTMYTYGEYGYCYLFRGDEIGSYRQFNGYLCKFRMYKDVLTADEMRALAKEV